MCIRREFFSRPQSCLRPKEFAPKPRIPRGTWAKWGITSTVRVALDSHDNFVFGSLGFWLPFFVPLLEQIGSSGNLF